jgi:uncharacterized membrane protein
MSKKTSKPAAPQHAESSEDQLGLERLIFFSDAVFAIAITLLALDIRLPAGEGNLSNQELLNQLLAIWPRYLGFVISFAVIGSIWLLHHRRFRYIKRYDRRLLYLNMLLLLIVAFIPFPTSIISQYGNQTATIFYALTMIAATLTSSLIWWHASHNNRLLDSHFPLRTWQQETFRPLLMPGIFLISIGIAFINDDLAKLSWGLAALLPFFLH